MIAAPSSGHSPEAAGRVSASNDFFRRMEFQFPYRQSDFDPVFKHRTSSSSLFRKKKTTASAGTRFRTTGNPRVGAGRTLERFLGIPQTLEDGLLGRNSRTFQGFAQSFRGTRSLEGSRRAVERARFWRGGGLWGGVFFCFPRASTPDCLTYDYGGRFA